MQHAFGRTTIDVDAVNRRSWYADSSIPTPIHIIYGPYETLSNGGRYKAVFKIKIDNNSDIDEVLHIDVISNKNPSVNSSRLIRGIHFKDPKAYQHFSINFEYRDEEDMEYRVIKLKKDLLVWIDYIAILKTDKLVQSSDMAS